MTANTSAGAAFRATVEWHAIDWRAADRTVRRLQARIVQATVAGKRGKVKALQRLLTHSYSGRVLAVRRVTENRGKHTPGVDGVLWDSPAKKATAVHALRSRGYHPRPLRRVYIPKSNGKMRPLGIPTMHDRAMQALYLLALEPIAEVTGDANSYGFRRERSTADAIAQCFTALARGCSAPWVLEGDIKSCFDRISHDWLLAHIPTDRAVLRKWLTAGYMEQAVLRPTTAGTPQGGIISPVLANMALDGLEPMLRARYPARSRRARAAKVNVIRYADDFVITGSSEALLREVVKPLVEAFLRERGLELSPEKTTITHIEAGFDFLGQHVRKYDGTLLIRPSKKSVQAVLTNIRAIVRRHRALSAGAMIERLNPIIRGWAAYHRHVASKRTFRSVDDALFQLTWRWAKRMHHNKGRRWIRQQYYGRRGLRAWAFTGTVPNEGGTRRQVWLARAFDTPIRRHVKVRAEANPFDPAWAAYFAARHRAALASTHRYRRDLLQLWDEQEGHCPACGGLITLHTGWHSHHLVWRSHGGQDGPNNRVLLHPTCHRQVHSRDLTVQKPRPTGALERLEPYEGKPSRTVLKGGGGGNAARPT